MNELTQSPMIQHSDDKKKEDPSENNMSWVQREDNQNTHQNQQEHSD